ncbi:MAG TPA: hypothetical protein DD626_03750 [Clostridiales bacterium]|nr:hypothetical protein [Clostridiales bacterium]
MTKSNLKNKNKRNLHGNLKNGNVYSGGGNPKNKNKSNKNQHSEDNDLKNKDGKNIAYKLKNGKELNENLNNAGMTVRKPHLHKNKRLEYGKSEEYEKEQERKLARKEQKAQERETRKKIKEEREELFFEKLYARRKKYADRLSKIEGSLGKTQIEVRGSNAQKALSAISKISKVEKVESTKEYTRFFVESKQCHKIIALLQNLCYDYKIINIVGVSSSIFRAFARAGIFAGIAASVCAALIYSSFVTRVSVRCEGASDYALNAQIDGILKEYGVVEGARVKSLNADELESAISSLDGVTFASVDKIGTHINVVYKTALKKENFVSANSKSVVAKKRAVVTRVIVEGGTAVCKFGDVVEVGDTLIDGYIEYGDNKIPVEAKGYAFGKVYYKRTKFFARVEKVENVVSSKTYTRFGMFGKVPKTPTSPFENYRLKTEASDFGYLLPIKIYSYRYEEIQTVEVENTLDEAGMKKAVYSELVADLTESATVLDVYYEVTVTEGGTYVTLTLEAEEII